MNELKSKKLIMVTENNNNKFYNMRQINNVEWEAEWGRVGVTSTTKVYPMRQWDQKYSEKVKKGYRDQTNLFVVASTKKNFSNISNSSISKIVKDLQDFANHSISSNYTVTTDQVTKKQIDEAQKILDLLTKSVKRGANTKNFNNDLLELWMTVPRKIANTRESILQFDSFRTKKDIDEANKMLTEEQATLDVMRGQVKVNSVQQEQDSESETTILDAMGLFMEPATESDKKVIKSNLGDIKGKFVDAWIVNNKRTKDSYDKFVKLSSNKKQELFWHGSRNENWWSILDSGLVLRPANAIITGKMFGVGTYFAPLARKSYGYTSARGSYWARGNSSRCFMALYNVHVGNQLIINKHGSWCYDLSLNNLKKMGDYDSVYAPAGYDLRNPEAIIYTEDQSTIQYLVELSA